MSMRTALMEMANNEATQYKKGDKVIVKVAKSSDPEMRQHAKEFGDKIGGVVQFQSGSIVSVKTSKGVLNPSVKDVKCFKESVDYGSRMTDAQKKKFHDLKKKMTGGPEYQKIMRKNQSPVKSDDEFHNLVLKKAMSEERAAWVPESIADEQVEAFMEATLAAVTEGADTFVFEGKSYKAKSKSEAKKLDPVGKADADIDNDGDVDSSDDYLKNRRKAIKKSMKDDDDDEVNEIDGAASGMRAADKEPTVNLKSLKKRRAAEKARKTARPSPLRGKKDMKFESTETIDEAMSGTYMTVEYDYSDNFGMLELYKNGKKIGSWDGYLSHESGKNDLAIEATKLAKKHGVNPNGLKTVDGEDPKRTGKLVPNKDFGFPRGKAKRESVEEEKAPGATAQHGVDANTQDTFEKQLSTRKGEKDFVDQHSMEVGMDIEKITAENKKSIEDALKVTPPRMGDQKAGDNSFVSPIQSNIIDGITKALQQMKTNN